jgi:hypothetical protein
MTELETVIGKLDKDLREASKTISRDAARFLVDTFYQLQKDRIRSGLRARALEEDTASGVMTWVEGQSEILEKRVGTMLDLWSMAHEMGPYLRSIHGIGPIISAGMLAHFDIEKAPTVGHFWAIAGLDPSKRWDKGKKRPWCASLKRLMFLAGDCFVKSAGSDKSYYGPIYKKRKEYEWTKNIAGDYADQCAASLAAKKFGDDTGAKKWYEGAYNSVDFAASPPKGILLPETPGIPMLPPGRIQLRAQRYAVKLFLAAFHGRWYEIHFGRPAPLPYPIAHLGHVHMIDEP